MNPEERFQQYVQRSPGCWEWQGPKWGSNKAYGQCSWFGKPTNAHRVAYLLYVGAIPRGMSVCHHCDNPACVRPDHLFLGTPKDNTHDAMRKGRLTKPPLRVPGHRYEAKTTFADRASIHRLHAEGVALREIARRFGVTHGAVRYHLRAFVIPST